MQVEGLLNTVPEATGDSGRQPTTTIPDELSVEEHGRLFNAYRPEKYLLPIDGDEQYRLNIQNLVWKLLLNGKLNLAPVKETAKVLDIGTGTGIWAIQYAEENSNAKIIGTDISLIQPRNNLPPNCTFERKDAEDPWLFDESFDFIHWRCMFSCFQDHKGMIAKVYAHLVPGGWAEFHDWGCEYIGGDAEAEIFYRNSSLYEWLRYVVAGGVALGRDFSAASQYRNYMIQAGFVDVVQRTVLSPINDWPLDPEEYHIGQWNCDDTVEFIGAVTKLLHAGGLPLQEIPAFVNRVRQECENPHMRLYCPLYVVYGKKPEWRLNESVPTPEKPKASVKTEANPLAASVEPELDVEMVKLEPDSDVDLTADLYPSDVY